MKQVKILGTGHYVPDNIVTNNQLEAIVDTTDEWITSRTGIKERRISTGENTSDIGTIAAKRALENADISAEDIDLIIVATMTADSLTPSTACIIQANIGAKKAVAFDIGAACSGFIYALSVGTQFVKTGMYNKILVIGAEVLSKIIDWKDRNTCVLFGDGAGAAVIGPSESAGITGFDLGADGQKGEVLVCKSMEVSNPFVKDNEEQENRDCYLHMEGKEVFKFAITVIGESVERLLQKEGIAIEDVDYIVPHQANLRIINSAAKRLGINSNKFYLNLDKYGNTSGASIPIALDEMNKKGLLKQGDIIVLVGFGAGLTYGSVLIKW